MNALINKQARKASGTIRHKVIIARIEYRLEKPGGRR